MPGGSDRGEEDRWLTARLRGKPGDAPPPGAARRSYHLIGQHEATRQAELERMLREARQISICGIASRTLVLALAAVAEEVRRGQVEFPWEELHYVTPTPATILAARTGVGLGPVVRDWQSAVDTIRNCARQDSPSGPPTTTTVSRSLRLSGMQHLYLEMLMRVTVRSTGRREYWVTVGPSRQGKDPPLLVVTDSDPNFNTLDDSHKYLTRGCSGLAIREVRCELVEPYRGGDSSLADPRDGEETSPLVVAGLQPYGTSPGAQTGCLPVAAVIIRANTVRGPVVVLRQRNEFSSIDSIGKYSLITRRLLEEDLAVALGVPIFADRDVEAAVDAMWRAARVPGPLGVPTKAFVRAAQREVYISCGLDIPEARLKLRGYQVISSGVGGAQLGFAVFELILNRHDPFDELEATQTWDHENLLVVSQSELYTEAYEDRLNRLLTQCDEWFRRAIFSRPVTGAE